MKKVVMSILSLMMIAVAGGYVEDPSPYLKPILPSIPCQNGSVYIEEDTHLMWQDQPYTDGEDGAYSENSSHGKVGPWDHMSDYCQGLHYRGFMDWRLPTSDELQHVHRKEGQVFAYSRGMDFWTSTPVAGEKHYVVYPPDAYVYKREDIRSNYVRCVRCYREGEEEE